MLFSSFHLFISLLNIVDTLRLYSDQKLVAPEKEIQHFESYQLADYLQSDLKQPSHNPTQSHTLLNLYSQNNEHFPLSTSFSTGSHPTSEYSDAIVPQKYGNYDSQGFSNYHKDLSDRPLKIQLDLGSFKELPENTAALVKPLQPVSFDQQYFASPYDYSQLTPNSNFSFNGDLYSQNNFDYRPLSLPLDPLLSLESQKSVAKSNVSRLPGPFSLKRYPFLNSTTTMAGTSRRRVAGVGMLSKRKVLETRSKTYLRPVIGHKINTRKRTKRSTYFHHTLASDEDKWIAGVSLINTLIFKNRIVQFFNF